jgi:hypothetical protein
MADINFTFYDQSKPFNDYKCGDFLLIHNYFGQPVFDNLALLHSKYKFIAVIMEMAHPENKYIDMNFTMLKARNKTDVETLFPIERTLFPRIEKVKNSILLDHQWLPFKDDIHYDWNKLIYKELESLKDTYKIYQLARFKDEVIPSWINVIPVMPFTDYLKAINGFEYFIITAACSYNNTALDMMALNSTVICPEYNKFKFLQEDIVKIFDVKIMKDVRELTSLIGSYKVDYDINKFTEIKECVNIINNTFIKIKNNNFKIG